MSFARVGRTAVSHRCILFIDKLSTFSTHLFIFLQGVRENCKHHYEPVCAAKLPFGKDSSSAECAMHLSKNMSSLKPICGFLEGVDHLLKKSGLGHNLLKNLLDASDQTRHHIHDWLRFGHSKQAIVVWCCPPQSMPCPSVKTVWTWMVH